MDDQMKRKQFHVTKDDEKMLKDLAQSKGWSEAEIVREAVREYAANSYEKRNPLLEMADKAERNSLELKRDLSVNHDYYLWGIHENEKQ